MDLLSHYSSSFLYAYAAGAVFLLLLCIERFDQPVGKGSFLETLVPRHLASHKEYLRTFLIYFGIMLLIYTLITMAGPSIVQGFQADTQGYDSTSTVLSAADPFAENDIDPKDNPVWFPLAVVLVLVGASTRYPIINAVELVVRKLTHAIIGIPQGIQKLAESLNRLRIDLDRLEEHEIELICKNYEEVTGERLDNIHDYYNDNGPHRGLVRNWIRLTLLYDILENRRRDLPKQFDTSVWHSYPGVWTKIKSARYELSIDRIRRAVSMDHNNLQVADREFVERTADEVETALKDLHSLIAACIAHSASDKATLKKIMAFFRLVPLEPQRSDYTQALIAAFVVVFLFVFGIVFITPPLVEYFGFTVSAHFPASHAEAFRWATSTVFLHGAAAVGALQYRARIHDRWKPLSISKLEIESTQYLVVIARAYIASVLGLLVWWVLSQTLAGQAFSLPSEDEAWIPIIAVLGMVTGFWVSYSLDVAERPHPVPQKRLVQQALMQGLMTGIFCYVLLALLPDEDVELDLEVYGGLIAGLDGLIIGIILILFVRKRHFDDGQRG